MRGFVSAVAEEARLRLPVGFRPQTVYFGGGTPSMLSPSHLGRLVEGLCCVVDFSDVVEWSFEANPATFTRAKVEHWRELGINRVSLGVQSMNARLLRLLGREHTPEDVCRSMRLLRECGMPQVNIDLMFALPGQTRNDWRQTLDAALDLEPDHISAYSLTYEEGTPFAARFGVDAGDEEQEAAMFELADTQLVSAGFRHYEISNYARPNCLSLHNLSCWRGEDYIGLGPGACGTWQGVRYQNGGDTRAYIEALEQGRLPAGKREFLTPEQRRTEEIGLRLRMDEGLPARLWQQASADFLDMLEQEGLAHRDQSGFLLLTRRGRLVADEIAVGLLESAY